ncbi:MAG: putative Ig domain-containing protein [Chloroflexota bacterium]
MFKNKLIQRMLIIGMLLSVTLFSIVLFFAKENTLTLVRTITQPLKAAEVVDSPTLTDTYQGTIALTTPIDLGALDIAIEITDNQGTLTGQIDANHTLIYETIPPLTGSIDTTSNITPTFTMTSAPFADTISGRPVERRVNLVGQILEDGEVLAGLFEETITGFTPQPLTTQGQFVVVRPPSSWPESLDVALGATELAPGEQTNVTATVYDQNGQPLRGTVIVFQSILGTLDPANGVTDENGQVAATFTADTQAGQGSITVLAESVSQRVPLQVGDGSAPSNQPPIVTNPGAQSSTEGDTVSLAINASDPDGDPLTFSATGLPTTLSLDSGSGQIEGTLATNSTGVYTVSITANDGLDSSSVSFQWTVAPSNPPPTGTHRVLYLSSTTVGTVAGVKFKDEDILAYDMAANTWSLYFDGSDVGLGQSDVDALALLDDGSILLSLIKEFDITGIGLVDDSDIVRFIPTSLGANTAGNFEWYFDASDVELTSNGEDINGMTILDDGRLVLSTLGNVKTTNLTAKDEDLILFTPTQLGSDTAGSWSLYFDGSEVGLNTTSDEDIFGAWVDETTDEIYLTTKGTFDVEDISGSGSDIFICMPESIGRNSSCTLMNYWNGTSYSFGDEVIDGFAIASAPNISPMNNDSLTGQLPKFNIELKVSAEHDINSDAKDDGSDNDLDEADVDEAQDDQKENFNIYVPMLVR